MTKREPFESRVYTPDEHRERSTALLSARLPYTETPKRRMIEVGQVSSDSSCWTLEIIAGAPDYARLSEYDTVTGEDTVIVIPTTVMRILTNNLCQYSGDDDE